MSGDAGVVYGVSGACRLRESAMLWCVVGVSGV